MEKRKGGFVCMKTSITVQERLKDLRVERRLSLDELAERTGISRAALGNYENDDFREISHGNIVALAKFYGVTTDYLLCVSEDRDAENSDMDISDLHLSGDAMDMLKSNRFNNRLLSEIITHDAFVKFIADAEIYVDGIATMRIKDLNTLVEEAEKLVLQKYGADEDDRYLDTLEVARINEDDYFCHLTHASMDSILRDIRKSHEKDFESEPDRDTTGQKMMEEMRRQLASSGNDPAEFFSRVICTGLEIDYDKLPAEQKKSLHQLAKRSPQIKKYRQARKHKYGDR